MVKVSLVVEDFFLFPEGGHLNVPTEQNPSLLRNHIHFANRQGLNSSTTKIQSSTYFLALCDLNQRVHHRGVPQPPLLSRPGENRTRTLTRSAAEEWTSSFWKPAILTVFFFCENRYVYDMKYVVMQCIMAVPVSLYLSSYSATIVATFAMHQSVSIYTCRCTKPD